MNGDGWLTNGQSAGGQARVVLLVSGSSAGFMCFPYRTPGGRPVVQAEIPYLFSYPDS